MRERRKKAYLNSRRSTHRKGRIGSAVFGFHCAVEERTESKLTVSIKEKEGWNGLREDALLVGLDMSNLTTVGTFALSSGWFTTATTTFDE